jgi:ParB family chromosome partitioning protein
VLEGEPKISIAKSLSKHQPVISAHLSMIDMPDALNNAYRTGRINTAQTNSQLRKLHKEYPQEVEIWLTKIDFVTRGNVDALKKDIIERENNDARAEQDNVKKTISKANDTQPETERETLTNTDSDNDTGDSTGTSTRSDSLHDHKDPSIKNPYIQIKYDDKIGSLMLDKYPSTPGQMWIRFENGQEMEVGASALHLVSLSEKSN